MLKIPTPVDESLINEVMNDLDFFTKGQMLYFERSQLFQTDNISTHTPATNYDPVGTYSNMHPQYDPANLVPENIFRAGQTANPHDFNLRAFKQLPSEVYFIEVGTPQKNSWILSLPTNLLIYTPLTNSIQYVNKLKEFAVKGNNIIITKNDKETKYPILVEETGNVAKVQKFLSDALSKKKSKTFEYLFSSFVSIDGYPPVKDQMVSFYRSVVENIQFLFLFSTIKKSCDQSIVSAWMEAAGHNIISLVPLTLYNYFQTLGEPNAVFRQDTFISALLTKIIEKDQCFIEFLDSVNVAADDLSEEFFNKFEHARFQPLSAFLLHHVYVEGRRAFPSQNAEYYGISGLLFLRIMTPYLSVKFPQMNMRLAALTPLYNMTESKVGIEKVKRMKDLLDQFETFPDDFGMEKTPATSVESIQVLVKSISQNASTLLETTKNLNISQLADKYYQDTTGKEPPEEDLSKIPDPNPDMSEPDSYSDLQSELSKSSTSDS